MTASKRRSHGLPFLHRNWTKGANHWINMGNKPSTPSREPMAPAASGPPGTKAIDNEEQFQRAAKRRRLNNNYDGFPLFEAHGSASRALRIEVLKIFHKDSTRYKNGIMNGLVAPNVKDIAHVRAKCKLQIYGTQGGQQVVLHVDSQLCDLKVFKNPASSSPMVRFASLEPFHIPEDKIYVERDDDAVFGLASSYSVLIEFESAGASNWPPLDLTTLGSEEDVYYAGWLPPRQWVMTAGIADIYNTRHRKEIPLKVKKNPNLDASTDFRIDIDVRWFTPISSQLVMRSQEKDVQASITVFDPCGPVKPLVNGTATANDINGAHTLNGLEGVNGINGVNGIEPPLEPPPLTGGVDKACMDVTDGASPEASEEAGEGELTPGRSRRTRTEVNYNVRAMFRTAIGREPRKRRRVDEETAQVHEQTITYILPPEQVQIERFSCLVCGAENERFNLLRAHYLSHPQYDFHFDLKPKGTVITVTANTPDATPLRPRIYQLGLPLKPLDLDKYVEGDNSWVTSRLGPDDGGDIDSKSPLLKSAQRPPYRRSNSKRRILVPNIKQPLFDPRSKVRLIPGTEIRQLPVDETWLLRKHRECLGDFTDVDPNEKEYMKEWDSFILPKHISSPQYLSRAFLAFVKEKIGWIVAKKSRAEEFSKHVALLLARRAIGEVEITEVVGRVNEARTATQGKPGVVEEEGGKRKGGSRSGCGGCGEPVPVSRILVCKVKGCKQRLWHVKCVENGEEALKMGRRWVCKGCGGGKI